MMKFRYIVALIAAVLLICTGCSSQRPTIAHAHIGHTLTGWIDTPGKKGLFVTAEKLARTAVDTAESAAKPSLKPDRIKQTIRLAVEASNASKGPDEEGGAYGVKQALANAVGHVTYAATSDDASDNVRQFADQFQQDAMTVLDRCDLIAALGNDIQSARSTEEIVLLTKEIANLTRANLFGEDVDGDGRIGAVPEEYGLRQLRDKIEQMLEREDPPYTTVNTWYLFNMIRLPSGKWLFRDRFQDVSFGTYGGGGGNGGGGGGGY